MMIIVKKQLLKMILIASAGCISSAVQADSVLAPLVIVDPVNFTETYFAFKMKGKGISDVFSSIGKNPLDSSLHYYYIQKLDSNDKPVINLKGLYDNVSTGGCKVTNSSGLGSSWDVVIQTASKSINATSSNFLVSDQSQPSGWLEGGKFSPGPFYGMMVIDDVLNLASVDGDNGRRSGSEGELSGFAYIINAATGLMFDYKLLNNPFSKRTGDFKASLISKTSIDWMWLPSDNRIFPALSKERTAWYTAVTGLGMTMNAENEGKGKWDEEVLFTQTDQLNTNSLKSVYMKNGVTGTGSYGNDEQVLSGTRDLKVKCLGFYDRNSFLTSQQINQTALGGWKRVHIKPLSVSGVSKVKAFGAITYRLDDTNGWFNGFIASPKSIGASFIVETSGTLANTRNNQHPSRGY